MDVSLRQRIRHLEQRSALIVRETRVLDQRLAITRPLFADESIKRAVGDAVDNSRAAIAWNQMAPLLFEDLARNFCRLFLDAKGKAASAVALVSKMKEPSMLAELQRRYRHCNDSTPLGNPDDIPIDFLDIVNPADINAQRDRDERHFVERWEKVTRMTESLTDDSVVGKLRTYRDKWVAHLEVQPMQSDPAPFDIKSLNLVYGDVFDRIERYISLPFDIYLLVCHTDYAVAQFRQLHKEAGSEMWRRILRVSDIEP